MRSWVRLLRYGSLANGGSHGRPPQREDENTQNGAHSQREPDLARMRRENQEEAAAFHERRKTRNAKWHQEQAERLPESQLHLLTAGSGRADEQGKPDDNAEPQRGQPKPRTGV